MKIKIVVKIEQIASEKAVLHFIAEKSKVQEKVIASNSFQNITWTLLEALSRSFMLIPKCCLAQISPAKSIFLDLPDLTPFGPFIFCFNFI